MSRSRRDLLVLLAALTPAARGARGLVVCTNANACGRVGHGFGHSALSCLQVLAGSDLEVVSGPCLTMCSKGVNARVVDDDGERGTLLFGINSYARCAEVHETLSGSELPNGLVARFEAAVEAQRELDEAPPGPRPASYPDLLGSLRDGIALGRELVAGEPRAPPAPRGGSWQEGPWTGGKLPQHDVGSPRAVWLAGLLVSYANAQLVDGRADDAASAAKEACEHCPALPSALEARANAELEVGREAAAREALEDLFWLEPHTAPWIDQQTSNSRRQLSFKLKKLRNRAT